MPDTPDPAAIVGHTASISALVAAIAGWVPVIVAIIPAIYYLILIWESTTVQHYVRNVRMRRKARRMLKLKAKAHVAQAALEAEELIRQARVEAREKVRIAKAMAKKHATAEAVKLEEKVPPV